VKYWGLANFDNGVRTSSFATLMAGVQQCHFMRDDVSPILLRQITKDIGLTVEELLIAK
jgi:hypothetical protein